ncbi:hypothetical protein BOW53_01480 [Solemya pervernicosa gill symbiont]|uniref:Dicarboxylate transport domain-containing protein n=2 Tax=Gammaproteobacteria incertae sedis TaxID=118884 RepID=A0A1T2LAA2_9GAMM|nr:hypothetical protein [Candidatus Reidiella endopervernicosa]OOZ42037.1 hypothetical protein BOW53_01480 [Solemya pervernicosa gill symbiont]QKQ27017.1 hypothetical protein HUE57_12570 [Candidatus Reidiella endopervernicosa]
MKLWLTLFSLLLLCIGSSSLYAVEQIGFELSEIGDNTVQIDNLEIFVNLGSREAGSLELTIDKIELAAPELSITSLTLRCDHAVYSADLIECVKGTAKAKSEYLQAREFQLSFSYHPDTSTFNFEAEQLPLFDGKGRIKGLYKDSVLEIESRLSDLSLEQLSLLIPESHREGLTLSGKGDIDVTLTVAQGDIDASGTIALKQIDLANGDDTFVTEQLSTENQFRVKKNGYQWSISHELTLSDGALYLEPLYLEFDSTPLRANMVAIYDQQKALLNVTMLTIEDDRSNRVHAKTVVNLDNDLNELSIAVDAELGDLAAVYQHYLQPALIGTSLDALEMAGKLNGQAIIEQGTVTQLNLKPTAIHLDDTKGRFGLFNLNGTIDWSDDLQPHHSSLSWDGGHLYNLSFASSELDLTSKGEQVELLHPVTLPLLDGALTVESFLLNGISDVNRSWQFSGYLEPVSMEAISHALGWPQMSGKLSGMIPEVTYSDHRVTMDGMLLARAFDGDVVISNLSLTDPLGVTPELNADIKITNLDLEPLTRTFSFGKIEGRLNGEINKLSMVSWMPNSFEARLYTPREDESRHRISQRAVDNISNLGGVGVAGSLSRSFLRFFDEFSYDRIGISCKLRNGICEMDGVEAAENGYYLVKGGGLPRIDVVGFIRRVDWDELIDRLKSSTLGESPVIE